MRIINIHNTESQPNNPDHVYIGRAKSGQTSKYGNPYVIGHDGTREEVIQMFKDLAWANLKSGVWKPEEVVADLNGKVLECFCYPKQCHGDVLVQLVKYLCGRMNVEFIAAPHPLDKDTNHAPREKSRATEKRAHEYYREQRPLHRKGEGVTPSIPSL